MSILYKMIIKTSFSEGAFDYILAIYKHELSSINEIKLTCLR